MANKKGTQITLLETGYYHPSWFLLEQEIASNTTSQILYMKVIVKDKNALASEIPTKLDFAVDKWSYSVPNDINWFTKKLLEQPISQDPKTVIPYNILVYGKISSGKSSFISSCYWLFQDEPPYQVPTSGTSHHVTTKLHKYLLTGTHINMWDTWGVTTENYQNNELTDLLEGVLDSGWEMTEKKEGNKSSLIEQNQATRHLRRIHAIIIVIPAIAFLEEGDPAQLEYLAKLRADILNVGRLGYSPILVLNKIDECMQDKGDIYEVNHPIFEEYRKKAMKTFGLQKAQVFCQINNVREEKPMFSLGGMTLAILSRAVDAARTFRLTQGI